MITTLEQFKETAKELCKKYGFNNDCYVGMQYRIDESDVQFLFSHYQIKTYYHFSDTNPEKVLSIVEKEMQKLTDPLGKAKMHLENLNKELLAAGKQPLSI